jgi:hypothetical protein
MNTARAPEDIPNRDCVGTLPEFDLTTFCGDVLKAVGAHESGGTGVYARYLRNGAGDRHIRKAEGDPYGCADAANLLYTLGEFPSTSEERARWVGALQNLQDPDTGLFREETHHPYHTTAHCVAALELFDAKPKFPLREMQRHGSPEALVRFLGQLDWKHEPWKSSHEGAGLFAARVLTGEADSTWQRVYFDWLWNEMDQDSGLLRKGCYAKVQWWEYKMYFPHLAGTFHYLFNIEYARMPIRYPEKMIDTALHLYRAKDFPLGKNGGFPELDWVYVLHRASRQTAHRFADVRSALLEFARMYLPKVQQMDPDTDGAFNDIHRLLGLVCGIAELQLALPGVIYSPRPLRQVMDRRPFV